MAVVVPRAAVSLIYRRSIHYLSRLDVAQGALATLVGYPRDSGGPGVANALLTFEAGGGFRIGRTGGTDSQTCVRDGRLVARR